MSKKDQRINQQSLGRREFLGGAAAVGIGASGLFNASRASAQGAKTGTVRVWGEPGPYGGVAVAAMNEWAQKNSPGIKFEIESIPWDGVYVKLMTDLAAKRPPSLVSVESPIAMQLMAEGLLLQVDELVDKIGRNRLVDGVKWENWGKWKDKQYVIPAHHQPHLLLVRMDIIKELGLKDPDTWDWNDLLNAAKTISAKKKMAGFCMALGRNLCTDYHFAALLHSAGGRMYDQANKFQVVFDSPQTVEALTFVKEMLPYMPKGAVEYSFLQVVDAHVTGQTAMSFYWGRTLGRAAEEAKPVFEATEAFNHARHPKTGRRSNWNDFQGWCIPAQNNPFIEEVKQALVYQQTSKEWLVKYCHSLVPNVGPTYKDVADSAELKNHPIYKAKQKTVDTYYKTSLANSSSTANELLQGVNPFAGYVHGRSILAQTVQKVVIDNMSPADAAKWGARELEAIRKENIRLLG
ncbi:MAG: extracellular solute-binding protein [Roseovarius sp.]|nr:extracellular solute-binding protein [Roseovarius sp.]